MGCAHGEAVRRAVSALYSGITMIEKHICLNCKSPLIKQAGSYALPLNIDQTTATDGLAIDLKRAMPVEIYWCESCRQIQLLAG